MHRILTRLFEDRGLALDHTYQLNFGGNMDFKNMLERERLESKKISKTQAVTSQIEDNVLDADDVHIGPSDHVPWLNDRKWAYIRMEGRNFGDVPLNLELKLEVWDSPNSAGVIIDAVRCAKLALDRGIGGPLLGPSAYFMKSPPVQYHDDVAHELVEEFAGGRPGPVWPDGLTAGVGPVRSPSALLGPPRVEAPAGLLLAERALVEAQLEQEVERLARRRGPGAMPEVLHDLAPVEVGADGVELLLLAQLRDAAPRARPCAGPSARALAALRVVQSQRVSSLSRSSSGPASRT